MTSRAARKRRGAARGTTRPAATVRAMPPSTPRRPEVALDDALPPWDRGPVRAHLRDLVDARRHLAGLLFVPAFGLAAITTFGPASELATSLRTASLLVLAVVVVEMLVRGRAYTVATRAALPSAQVNAVSSTFYVFMRAHRPRSVRRPAPRTRP